MITSRKKTEPEIVSKESIDAIEVAAIAGKPLQGEAEKLGPELLDEATAEPTLNRYLDRSPKLNTAADKVELVRLLQRKRQLFITAEAKKKAGEKVEEKIDDERV